ncbi:unnamed protein product [Rhizophagus irregularis]|nr:unnamed protein product [Rhizophagus irregularis]
MELSARTNQTLSPVSCPSQHPTKKKKMKETCQLEHKTGLYKVGVFEWIESIDPGYDMIGIIFRIVIFRSDLMCFFRYSELNLEYRFRLDLSFL